MRPGSHLVLSLFLAGTAFAQSASHKIPRGMSVVQPISRNSAGAGQLRVARGRFFSYALPQGWRVGEEGQYALSLVAPDNHALTVMVGNAGLPPNYPPDRFVQEKLMAMRLQSLQLGPARQAAPSAGFHHAYEFDVAYVGQRGLPWRGVAKCNVAPAYDTALLVMTAALSVENQWGGYSPWLPLVAAQISAIDGAAFGRRGVMAQNLQMSREYGEAARAYRDWSQRNWQQVTDQRNDSDDRRNYDRRENLGSTNAYNNPYDSSATVDLPQTYKYFWVNRQGTYVGTNDPSVNPNDGSTGEWKKMPLHRP
jgi:hypothetical protein